LDIRLVVKAIARNRHNVQIPAIRIEPLLSDFGTVIDDGTRFEVEFLLAILEQLSDVCRLEEGFSAADVKFFHACLGEHMETLLGLVERQNVEVLCGMEAKFTGIVAFPASWASKDG
jgi:hypothetical protein